ncbi:hypothetical protein J6590_093624 [Homalodisca vitripennis]|nr:hypothetical protein J6590_093624 [Homalodisca vitripennis]
MLPGKIENFSILPRLMPEMFIFPRKKENPPLMNDAPPEYFAVNQESGWINKNSFLV